MWISIESEIFFLTYDRVVKEEHLSVSEHVRESVFGEVPIEGTRDIGEHEGSVLDKGFWDDSGQSGQYIVGASSNPRVGAISEDENGGDGVDMLTNLSSNTPLVEFVILNTASVG